MVEEEQKQTGRQNKQLRASKRIKKRYYSVFGLDGLKDTYFSTHMATFCKLKITQKLIVVGRVAAWSGNVQWKNRYYMFTVQRASGSLQLSLLDWGKKMQLSVIYNLV